MYYFRSQMFYFLNFDCEKKKKKDFDRKKFNFLLCDIFYNWLLYWKSTSNSIWKMSIFCSHGRHHLHLWSRKREEKEKPKMCAFFWQNLHKSHIQHFFPIKFLTLPRVISKLEWQTHNFIFIFITFQTFHLHIARFGDLYLFH